MFIKRNNNISDWKSFARDVRGTQEYLFERLDNFPESVLVTGCQRSGGTMLARVITNSDGMVNYWFGKDDELDAALVLSGKVEIESHGRYCFQTTYLNERYPEYFEHPSHYIIWSLRNPNSVVYSMVYNWKRFALNELFIQCGFNQMNYQDRIRFQRFGLLGIPPIRRSVYAYNGKIAQVFKLAKCYPEERLTVVEYDNLVREKERLLPILYEGINLAYRPEYAEPISDRSLNKRSRLSKAESQLVEDVCMPVYEEALKLVSLS